MRPGIIGYRLPPLNTAIVSLRPGDLIVLATDGLREGYLEAVSPLQELQETTRRVLASHGRSNDDALLLVARYRGAADA
jgi:negative regulator of sigma-B (phosphoserine phosphatase)